MDVITRRTAIGIMGGAAAGTRGARAQQGAAARAVVPLAGEWRFQADPTNSGPSEGWYRRKLRDALALPGSLETNGRGVLNTGYSAQSLNRKYIVPPGGVWYQREIEAPASWMGRRVALVLERSSASSVWLDGREVGERKTSRRTPHVHELGSSIEPGRHTLTILAGTALPGRNELVVTGRVWVRRLNVIPDVPGRTARVSAEIVNDSGAPASGVLRLAARSFNCPQTHVPGPVELRFEASPGRKRIDGRLALGDGMLLWDEFRPALYRLTATLSASGHTDRVETSFGMRDIAVRGGRIEVNGRVAFLRGRSTVFRSPLTGMPPFDLESWQRFFRIDQSLGMNHLRESSFPPEAAFEAADLAGFYLQPELNARSPLTAADVENLVAEGVDLLETYGNHPSFCLFTLGNELSGERAAMRGVVRRLREHDGSRLYASGSNNFWGAQQLEPGDDFWVTWRTRKGAEGAVRASFGSSNQPDGHLESGPPNTYREYRKALEGVPVPVIAHEIGEFQVYPNYDEIPKFTGVLLPRDMEIFRDRLAKAGMLDQWRDFFRASGALAVLCYKEDVEAALRTPGLGGFQILDLADWHVDEGALVGILDKFNDSKGLIEPVDWRQFCNATVPLARFAKFTWRDGETFAAEAWAAHYGPADLSGATLVWSLTDGAGAVVRNGEAPALSIRRSSTSKLGSVSFDLRGLKTPARYDLELRIRGTPYRNRWPVWVFSRSEDTQPPAGVRVARSLDAAAQRRLLDGERVVLLPDIEELVVTHQMAGKFVDGQFGADFWSYKMFQHSALSKDMKPSAGTLGLVMDPRHPALARFPTESHTNWQWWRMIKNSRAVVLDEAPAGYRPIVQVIDNVSRNYKLGLVFEFRVGKGRLLICTMDLLRLKDEPEAAQLLHSLLAYVGSAEFEPSTEIDFTMLRKIIGIQVVHA